MRYTLTNNAIAVLLSLVLLVGSAAGYYINDEDENILSVADVSENDGESDGTTDILDADDIDQEDFPDQNDLNEPDDGSDETSYTDYPDDELEPEDDFCEQKPYEEPYEEPELSVEAIKRALDSLPDGYRIVLSMRLFEESEFEEIAEALQIKESTVRSQYVRGRDRLAKMLKNEE